MFCRLNIYLVASLIYISAANASAQPIVGPSKGTLVLSGGFGVLPHDDTFYKRVIQLAGGPDQLLVIIPSARGSEPYDETYAPLIQFRRAGARNVVFLHTNDRNVADSEQFVQPLRKANGVFIGGGDQTILAEVYLRTRTQRELQTLLERGGVVAGSSAGAMIMGSFLARGVRALPLEDPQVIGDHTEGFGLLRDVVLLPHLLVLNRQFDLLRVIQLHPNLLGIGIDEATAIVVQQDTFEVIGKGPVAIYDTQHAVMPSGSFYFLSSGDSFDLATREAFRGKERTPLSRIVKNPK